MRPVYRGEDERRIPVAKEHPVIVCRAEIVCVALDESPVLVEDRIVMFNLQVLLEEGRERVRSYGRQHPDGQGDGKEEEDLLPLSYPHDLSERYRRDPFDLVAELQVLEFLETHNAGDQV